MAPEGTHGRTTAGIAGLRAALVLLVLMLLGALGIVYGIGEAWAAELPEFAYLRMPIFLGIAVGAVPVLAGIVTVWQLVDAMARPDAAFSGPTIGLLHRLRLLILLTCGYFALGVVLAWVAAGDFHPGLLLIWLALEAVGLFAYSLVTVLERLFRSGAEYRADSELTV